MKRRLPQLVLQAPPHSLVLLPTDAGVELYVKEDEFTLARYPTHCSVEFRLADWDDGDVICIVLLVRLADSNLGTFERWLNAADPGQLRVLQLLASQSRLDLALVSERLTRTFRRRNRMAGKAAGLIATLRVRRSWTAEEYEERRRRLDKLYPSSPALWRGTRERKR